MLKRVQIECFRGFRELDLKLGVITGIVGPNSSGKTTVLHAIRLVADALSLALEDLALKPVLTKGGVQVCREVVIADPNRLSAVGDWAQLFTDREVGQGARVRIALEFATTDSIQAIELELTYARNATLKLSLVARSTVAEQAVNVLPPKSKRRAQVLREVLQRTWPLAVFVPAFYGVTTTEEYRTQPVVQSLLGRGDQSHIVRNLVARLDGPSLARLNSFTSRALRTTVSRRTPQQEAETRSHLEVFYRDTNGELELASAGAGLVSLIALFAAMEGARAARAESDSRPTIFLLDEPEAHLHPRLQGDVGEAIAQLAEEFGLQLIIATHSIEMINRLGRREQTVLLAVDRSRSVPVLLDSEQRTLAELDQFCDLTPFASLSFLASRRVLFYEGPTDYQVIERCARLYFRSDDERLRRFRQYIPVALDGVGNVTAHGVLRPLLDPKLFPKMADAPPLRAALMQDRDYSRAPKAPTRKNPAAHLETVEAVWSHHSIESLFLTAPGSLTEWLQAFFPPQQIERALLETALERAIERVNEDVALCDAAIDHRFSFHRRPDKEGKIANEKLALKAARAEVRAEPWVWQRGKDRASRVLTEVRASLPVPLRKRLRGSLVDLITNAPVERVLDPATAIPQEIAAFLDLLVAV